MRWQPGMKRIGGRQLRPAGGVRVGAVSEVVSEYEKEAGLKGEVVGRVPKPGEFDRALSMVENYKLKVAALRKQVEELEGKGKKTVKEVKVKSKAVKKPVKKTVPKKKEK